MAFRFSWVLAFLVIQVFFWIIWKLKDRSRDSIFPNASEKVRTVSRLNLDKGRIEWRNRLILIGLALLALAASGPQIGMRVRPIERKGVDILLRAVRILKEKGYNGKKK